MKTRYVSIMSLAGLTAWTATVSVAVAQPGPTDDSDRLAANTRYFGTVEIAALENACLSGSWKVWGTPEPSAAFIALVETRPQVLLATGSGPTWMVGRSERQELEPVDPARYPLSLEDLKTASAILATPYYRAWVDCMISAVRGDADARRVGKLAEMAANVESPRTRALLLAGLGMRLNVLSERNPEWARLIFGKDTPRAIALAMKSFRALEHQKVLAVNGFQSGSTEPVEGAILFHVAAALENGRWSVDWADFHADGLFGAERASLKSAQHVRGWAFPERDMARQVYQVEKTPSSNVVTLMLSPEHHVILKGDFDSDKLNALEAADSLDALLRTATDSELEVFLSRPGSNVVGVCATRE